MRTSAYHRHCVVHKTHLPGSFAVPVGSGTNVLQLSPTSGKVSNDNLELLSPTEWAIALRGRVTPEITCKFLSCRRSLIWIFVRAVRSSLSDARTCCLFQRQKAELQLDLSQSREKWYARFFLWPYAGRESAFWHDCTPLSPSYSSWTFSSCIIPLLTAKVLFPPLPPFTVLCYIRETWQ